MNKIDIFKRNIEVESDLTIWQSFEEIYNYKDAPIEDDELIELCKSKLNHKITDEEKRSWLSILGYLKKDESFNPEFLKKYFRVRNGSINTLAVRSLRYSNSKVVEKVLVDVIENPKSDHLGETAAIILHYEIANQEVFDRLVSIYPKLKKDTKNAVWYLIFTKSFDNRFNSSEELKIFLDEHKVKSLRKWHFKNWKELPRDKASMKLIQKLTKLKTSKTNKSFKNEIFYVPISNISYIMIRANIDYENDLDIRFDIGKRSFIRAFIGRLDHELICSFTSNDQGMIKVNLQIEFIENLISTAEKEILDIEDYIKSNYKDHTLNPPKESKFPIASFIAYSLFKNDYINAKYWANYWKKDNEQWLQEYWLRYCKELSKITIANTGYDGMPPIVSTSTYP